MNRLISISICLGLAISGQVIAQTEEELNQQLEAQKQINELLKQRIESLERELQEVKGEGEGFVDTLKMPTAASRTPEVALDDPESDRALERALVRRGLSVLPSKAVEVTPGLFWDHSGSELTGDDSDFYTATFDARVGLPGNSMIGIGLPYILRGDTPAGDGSGIGNTTLRAWKQFRPMTESKSSLIGSAFYRFSTADDSEDIALGSEFDQFGFALTASKANGPVVFSGGASYRHAIEDTLDGVDFQPGDAFSVSGSASLAITPDISGNMGLSMTWIDDLERDGDEVGDTSQTIGLLNLGAGFVVGQGQFLFLSGSLGVTDDAPDYALGFSVPYRF